MKLVIYTHSEYNDIFQIQKEHLLQNVDNIHNIVVVSNKPDELYDDFKTLFYDEKLPYAGRLLKVLNEIEDEHILICHDNDIIIGYDENVLNTFTEFMKNNNVGRIDLCCLPQNFSNEYINTNKIIIDNENYVVKNFNYYNYSVGPSIWNRNIILNIFNNFKNKNYRNIEDDDVQQYTKSITQTVNIGKLSNTECFGGRIFNSYFKWLHITIRGKLVYDRGFKYHQYVLDLYKKYNIKR